MDNTKLAVLLVEDDANDVLLMCRALRRVGADPVHICQNGEEAIQYLQGVPPYGNREQFPIPTLIITDLNMPRLNGLELLRWLRAHPHCHLIPVVMLSASGEPRDIDAAYKLGSNAFFQKPMGLERLVDVVAKILSYWAEALPPVPPNKCD